MNDVIIYIDRKFGTKFKENTFNKMYTVTKSYLEGNDKLL